MVRSGLRPRIRMSSHCRPEHRTAGVRDPDRQAATEGVHEMPLIRFPSVHERSGIRHPSPEQGWRLPLREPDAGTRHPAPRPESGWRLP
jgi:hypothetical protein